MSVGSPNSITSHDIVRGTEVAYYIVCKRKLWLFAHNITFEHTSDAVAIGRLISETSFKREHLKEVELSPGTRLDFVRFGDEIIVHEVKKSKKLDEAHKLQVKFYIYQLRKLGLNVQKAVLHYPKSMRIEEVFFTKEDEKLIAEALKNISSIKNRPTPPPVEPKPYCKSCAYFQFCFI